MTPVRGPAVPRRRLGSELRRLREEAGLRIEQVADELECSTSKISRLETGKGVPRARDVRDMLTIYGVDDVKVRDRLIRWAREGQQQGWWEKYADLLRPGKLRQEHLETLYALETDASAIRTFQTAVVPGLLQTREYARELIRVAAPALEERELDRLVDLRMQRQQVLDRATDPLTLSCVLDETVLYRPIGGREVMRAQLKGLLDAGRRPNVTVRILPLSVGPHPAMMGPFVILEFADQADHDVVYLESHAGNTYLEQPDSVHIHQYIYQSCEQAALDPKMSAKFIAARIASEDQSFPDLPPNPFEKDRGRDN